MTREEIFEACPEALLYDGFDDAIIGLAERINLGPVVAYDKDKIIAILAEQMEISEEDYLEEFDIKNGLTVEDIKYEMAVEYFEYNVLGGWVGEQTPIFITLKENL